MNVTEKALQFAIKSHEEQVRKYTLDPYINHCVEVADLVRNAGGTEEMISAAYLHDVVEDTPVELDTIRSEFGDTICDYVEWLTDPKIFPFENRAVYKARIAVGYADAPKEVKTIKLCDLISNSQSIVKYDTNFAKVFLREKRLLMEALRGGDHAVWKMANNMLKKDMAEIGITYQ